MIDNQTKQIVYTGICAALVCIATFTIKIPSLNGYTHLGDCMIFISVLILGWKKGALASGTGAALADLFGGYVQWVIPSFFIKAIMAIIMGLITEKLFPNFKFAWAIGAIVGGVFQVVAYTLVKIPLFGLAYAIVRLPILIAQTLSGVILALMILILISQLGIIKKMKEI